MNPYQHLVSEYVRFAKEGKSYPLGGFAPLPRPDAAKDAPKVLIFSPHPDDEVIIGGLALRLLREMKWNVINVAVTQGSNKQRQAERLAELEACCECIGFGLQTTIPGGLEKVTVKGREQEPAHWAKSVKVIAEILAQHQPRVILFPHDNDWNSSHIGTHYLMMDALKSLPADFECYAVETEFWGAMSSPNLMVEIMRAGLGRFDDCAHTFHVGGGQAQPLSSFLAGVDAGYNVRRGGEVAGGQGAL